MSRARWAHLFRDDPAARHTANSFEQAADELCFLLGPVLATLLCTGVALEAGTAVAAALLLTGVLLSRPSAAPNPRRPRPHPCPALGREDARPAALPRPAPAPAHLPGHRRGVRLPRSGHRRLRGRARLPSGGGRPARPPGGRLRRDRAAARAAAPAARPGRRFLGCVAAMAALLTLPLAAAASGAPLLLAAALLTAGTATAPAMVTGMGLVQSRIPAGRLNEGWRWP
ncbi:hypothetical protein O1L55_16830 [Streptomyces albulus]|nr:hypothetical protein [Streptomyces noursei]